MTVDMDWQTEQATRMDGYDPKDEPITCDDCTYQEPQDEFDKEEWYYKETQRRVTVICQDCGEKTDSENVTPISES